ncbi:MAG: RNA 2',3'-cyclic phosphodiesterase [Terriglobales bacterium]
MRLFVAVDIAPEIRERIARFMEGMREFAPDARWVKLDSFHITLKFIGEKSAEEMDAIQRALADIQSGPATVSFRGTGFFPNPRSARVFWVGIEADPNLAALADKVDKALARLRIPREDHEFTPHLTLARGGDPRHPRGGSGRPQARPGDQPSARFARVQQKLANLAPPDFGAMTADEFFLYESKLSPAGAHYTKIARFPLVAPA